VSGLGRLALVDCALTSACIMLAVPKQVSEEEFWIRYLFHKHNIEDEEKKRQELLRGEKHALVIVQTSADGTSRSSS
jgi:hypothetical protein